MLNKKRKREIIKDSEYIYSNDNNYYLLHNNNYEQLYKLNFFI